MPSPTIQALRGFEILDSRGNPTLEVEVTLSDGTTASFQVPSGASTGRHEALELRDGPGGRYGGKAVSKALTNVERGIAPAIEGRPADDQGGLDEALIALDGTPNKSRLGANAILGVSGAVARAAARAQGLPLWRYLAGDRPATLPLPMINILSGGLHAGGQLDFQDYLVQPHGFETLAEALEATVAIHRATERLLRENGHILTGVADEGGLGPRLGSNEEALEFLVRGIEAAGYEPGRQVTIALDVAATHFVTEGGRYALHSEGRELAAREMVDLLEGWTRRYPVVSIEDALAEDDWEGWKALTARLGASCALVGDDLFTTNPERLERGIREKSANAVLVKMNQIGTLTETFRVIDRAREAGFAAVVSARSGETEDDFLADLAVASGAGRIKVGSVTRSERLAKYNRLLRIESEAARTGAGPAPLTAALPRP